MSEAEIDSMEALGRAHLHRALTALEAAIVSGDATAKKRAECAQFLAQQLLSYSRAARKGWGMV